MKKFLAFCVAICFTVCSFAQRQIANLVIDPLLYEQFTPAYIDSLEEHNPSELLRLNFKMTNYAIVAGKIALNNSYEQILNNPQHYFLNNGGVIWVFNNGTWTQRSNTYQVGKQEIMENGYVNPFQYNFPQDTGKYNIFPLEGENDIYVIVRPKNEYEAMLNARLRQFGFIN